MYSHYYGFSEKPFDVTPDTRFLYLTPDHQETLASLLYGIQHRRGFITIIGEVGTGKTTLLNAALDRLNDKTRVAVIFNTDVTFEQLLNMALFEWGLVRHVHGLSKVIALQCLNRFAIEQLAKGGNVVLIIDEAQNLDNRTMENLRLLSNLETRQHKLIQIVLSGQPELDTQLGQHELRQLAQRISLRRYVSALSQKDTFAYLDHRLAIANHSGASPFSPKAQQLIWEYSGGVPRKINILCDNAFLIGYGLQKKKIRSAVVKEATRDLKWIPFSDTKSSLNDPPSETAVPRKKTKPSMASLTIAVSMSIFGIFMFAVSFLPGKTIFNVPQLAFIRNTINGTVQEKIQPDHKKPQAPLKSTVAPSQPIISYKVLADLPKEKVEPEIKTDPERKAPLPAPIKEENKIRLVQVQKGETLYGIITHAFGTYDGKLLNTVLQKNPEVIDPNKIFAGQVIKVPAAND